MNSRPGDGFIQWAEHLIHRDHASPHRGRLRSAAGKVVWQTSTMDALLAGIYDGEVTLGQVRKHGDFGLGTFDKLDGELIILDGFAYRVRSGGGAEPADSRDKTPFAVVTRFSPDIEFDIPAPMLLSELRTVIDEAIPTKNFVAAVRVDGTFRTVTTRTVSEQHHPYVGLAEATANQPKSTEHDIAGTIVGFRTPDYEQGIAVAGYHLHFISSMRSVGGHVFDAELARGKVSLSIASEVHLSLPQAGAFLATELVQPDSDTAIRNAEG